MARLPTILLQRTALPKYGAFWGCECRNSILDSYSDRAKVGSRRWYSRSRDPGEVEAFDITCGSSGRITVDLHSPQALANPSNPLIIYLPPTGVHIRHLQQPIPTHLITLPNTALARINYRWNIPSTSQPTASPSPFPPLTSSPFYNSHPFPNPLHDTLHAFSHITTTVLASYTPKPPTPSSPYAASPAPRKIIQRPLFIYGSFLGGTLATSLALTESHISNSLPFRIAGLITKNAIFDWTGIAVSKDPRSLSSTSAFDSAEGERSLKQRESKKYDPEFVGEEPWTEQILHDLKPQLFTSPQSCFDVFASPFLFFRTPSFAVPSRWAGTPVSSASNPESMRYSTLISDPEIDSGSSSSDSETKEARKDEEEIETQRISYLKFPPRHTTSSTSRNLKLPRSLFLYTSPSPTPASRTTPPTANKTAPAKKNNQAKEEITPKEQAQEMKRIMQRSILLYEFKERSMWDEGFDANGEAEGRVQIQSLCVKGEERLEDEGDEEMKEGGKVKEWIEECLG